MVTANTLTLADELVQVNKTLNQAAGKHEKDFYLDIVLNADVTPEATDLISRIIEEDSEAQALGDKDYFRVDGIVARVQVAALRLDKSAKAQW